MITRSNSRKNMRKRSVKWFNPPYNAMVLKNTGKAFLQLINKHFSPSHRYRRIFKWNSIKLSYSCCPNIESIVSKHNRQMLAKHNKPESKPAGNQKMCNWRKPAECPLAGNYLKAAIIYRATVSTDEEEKTYIGVTEQTFKKRFPKHKTQS